MASMEKLEKSLRCVTLHREQYLSEQESKPEFVYFPETAVISHQRTLLDGRTVEVALTGRDGSVGVSTIFGSGMLDSSAHAVQAGTAVRIEREVLMKILRIFPEMIPPLVADIGTHVKDLSRHVVSNTYHDITQRLAAWLLSVNDLSGEPTVDVTHEQLSKVLGVFRPSVTCTALELRSNGLIDYSRGKIVIKDHALLIQAACSCYAERAASC
jgi:CRP-like cAMP-binding protein